MNFITAAALGLYVIPDTRVRLPSAEPPILIWAAEPCASVPVNPVKSTDPARDGLPLVPSMVRVPVVLPPEPVPTRTASEAVGATPPHPVQPVVSDQLWVPPTKTQV